MFIPPPAALRVVTPSAGPPGTTVSLLMQAQNGFREDFRLSSWWVDPLAAQFAIRSATGGAADYQGVTSVGRFICRQDVDDATSPIEVWAPAAGRFIATQRFNCSTASGISHGIDPTSSSFEVGQAAPHCRCGSHCCIRAGTVAVGRQGWLYSCCANSSDVMGRACQHACLVWRPTA